ncbi:MAG: nuclear transport factor 2 family protein [Anaerolineae bacterium]|nr:nuclear transport factor 2 family protein [Gemmatimonadaceae bacterium]
MRLLWPSAVLTISVLALACDSPQNAPSVAEKSGIADSLKRQVAAAYDFSRENVAANLISLYPDTGRVVAAAAGRVTTSMDTLRRDIAAFWENVGRNMRNPEWKWQEIHVDVLSRDAAVMTATYRIPHMTPAGAPHEIGGAWTAVFVKRDGRWVIVQEHLSDVPVHSVTSSPAPE